MNQNIRNKIIAEINNGKNILDIAYENMLFILKSDRFPLIDMRDFDEDGFDVLYKNEKNNFSWLKYPNLRSLPNCIWELLEDPENFQDNVKNYNNHLMK